MIDIPVRFNWCFANVLIELRWHKMQFSVQNMQLSQRFSSNEKIICELFEYSHNFVAMIERKPSIYFFFASKRCSCRTKGFWLLLKLRANRVMRSFNHTKLDTQVTIYSRRTVNNDWMECAYISNTPIKLCLNHKNCEISRSFDFRVRHNGH